MSRGRARRLRGIWFALGILAGVALSSAASLVLAFSSTLVREISPLSGLQALYSESLTQSEQGTAQQGTKREQTAVIPVVAVAEPEVPEYLEHVTLTARSGDTLSALLNRAGLIHGEVHRIVKALRPVYDPRTLRPRHHFTLQIDKDTQGVLTVRQLTIALSATEEVILSRNEGGTFDAMKKTLPTVKETARASGTITSSLYETARYGGIPEPLVGELINAYSYDVDFQRDIKSGDALEVLFEQTRTEEGVVVQGGQVLHATLTLGGKDIAIYRYTDSGGSSGYYNAKGESIRKALLKTPINGARISSRYGKRRHPVLGYTKMHKGVDFAAPTGTPVFAAGDGVVERASRYGGYGKYVRIRHNGKYASAYAHLHRYGKDIRAGRRVKQGQVIGYVGSTGRSTGPHLHYEILAYGKQINPSRQKFKTGRVLKGKELARFKTHAKEMESLIASLPPLKTEIAAAEPSR